MKFGGFPFASYPATICVPIPIPLDLQPKRCAGDLLCNWSGLRVEGGASPVAQKWGWKRCSSLGKRSDLNNAVFPVARALKATPLRGYSASFFATHGGFLSSSQDHLHDKDTPSCHCPQNAHETRPRCPSSQSDLFPDTRLFGLLGAKSQELLPSTTNLLEPYV